MSKKDSCNIGNGDQGKVWQAMLNVYILIDKKVIFTKKLPNDDFVT